jgi:hypothetical protein
MFRRGGFDGARSLGEIGVTREQGPQTMHVIGQNDPSVDVEGSASARFEVCRRQLRNFTRQKHENRLLTIIYRPGLDASG